MVNQLTDQDIANHPKVKGLRMTRQRIEVYKVLMNFRDHPTACLLYTSPSPRD